MIVTEPTEANPRHPPLGNQLQRQFVHNKAGRNRRSFVLFEQVEEAGEEIRIEGVGEKRRQCQKCQAKENESPFASKYDHEIEKQHESTEYHATSGIGFEYQDEIHSHKKQVH